MKRFSNHQIRCCTFRCDEKQRASALILINGSADGCFYRSSPIQPRPEDLIP